MRFLCLCLALTILRAGSVLADETSPSGDPSSRVTDVGDLWRLVRHKDTAALAGSASDRFFVVAPSIGSKPSTGLNGGLSGNMAFFRGDRQTTHISSISGGFKVSQKKQTLGGLKLAMFAQDDRWFVPADARFQLTSQNTYGLGTDTVAASAENAKYTYRRLYETVYRQVRESACVFS